MWMKHVVAILAVLSCCGVSSLRAATSPAETSVATGTRPDWSGVWQSSDGPIFDPTALARPENAPFTGGIKKLTAGTAAALSRARDFPPYNAEYEARYGSIIEKNRSGVTSNDPSAACLPLGMPRLMAATYPLEFIILPERVIIIFESDNERRMIWTDGRKHSNPDDITLTFNGESIGHWEGETLVVDTIGLRPEPSFDATGAMHSDALHVEERIRRLSTSKIEDRMVFIDPKAFRKQWEVTRSLDLKPGYQLMEYFCGDNNRGFFGASSIK